MFFLRKFFGVYFVFLLRAFSLLLITPYLSGTFDQSLWGKVIASQALIGWITLVVDFGTSIFASNYLAVVRSNQNDVKRLVSGVLSIKIFICLIILPILVIYSMLEHQIPRYMLVYTFLVGVIQGMSTLWFFQGLERLEKFSYAEIAVRIIYLLSIFIFVKSDSDNYIVFLSLIINLGLLYGSSYVIIWKNYTSFTLSVSCALEVLRRSYAIASFSLITSVYSVASVFLYSLTSSSFNVALYGNGDRFVRASIALIGPLNQIFAPRSSIMFSRSQLEGWKNFKKILLFYGLLGVFATMGLYFCGPFISETIFGSKYIYSGYIIRYLSILLFLTAINTAMTYHFFVPSNQSQVMNKVYVLASLICAASIYFVVPVHGILGMVFSVIIPEVFALLCMGTFIFRWKKRNVICA